MFPQAFVLCLYAFFVAENGKECKDYREASQIDERRVYIEEAAAFQIDGSHDFDEVFWGYEYGNHLCPFRHRLNRGEQAAHKNEHHDEEEHYEHGLLHRTGYVGDDLSETGNDKCEYQ